MIRLNSAGKEVIMEKKKKGFLSEYTGSRMRRNEARTGLLFVLPWIIGFLVFTLYPI